LNAVLNLDSRVAYAWLQLLRVKYDKFELLLSIGRFRYIASRAERWRFVRNSVWAFNLVPAFPRGALTL
jgi:hypothetical protein